MFDECHHAIGAHPMLRLMALFKDCPEKDHPRVIGLTGMLTAPDIKPADVLNDLKRLESTYRGIITTAKGSAFNDVLMYSTCPNEMEISYEKNLPSNFQKAITNKVDDIKKILKTWPFDDRMEEEHDPRRDKQPKFKKKMEKICKDFLYEMQNLGLYVGYLANLAAIVDLELRKREADTSATKMISRVLITCKCSLDLQWDFSCFFSYCFSNFSDLLSIRRNFTYSSAQTLW